MRSIAQLLGAESDAPALTNAPVGSHIMSGDPEAARCNPPEPVPCEYCGRPRYTMGYVLTSAKILWSFAGPARCSCPGAVAAHEARKAAEAAEEAAAREAERAEKMRARVQKLVADSGMNARFRQRTFARMIQTPENREAITACREYADTFREMLPRGEDEEPGINGLFITGPAGTGKTHLAAAIANQLIQGGTAVICMTMIDLLERIKRTFDQSQRNDWGDSEADILNTYRDVPLLIIDDMGKEPPTEWAVSKIYAIINARYEALMPTIVTTNYTDAELIKRLTPRGMDPKTAEATVDRLREMCVGIMTTGESWRGR